MAESKTSPEPIEATTEGERHDMKLVAELLKKNRKAAAEFVALYTDPVYAYVYQRLIPRTDLVDDIVQDVFLAAWSGLPGFQGRSSLKSWVLGIARHKVESYYRKRLREPDSFDFGDPSLPDFGEEPELDLAIDRTRKMAQTRKVLEELPETYSLLLLWRYWEKRSVREMAEGIGRSEKAVERSLARARQQFRRRWVHGKRSASRR